MSSSEQDNQREASDHVRVRLPAEFLNADEAPILGAQRKEHAVVPGVYFTPGVNSSGASENVGEQGEGSVPGPSFTDISMMGREELVHKEREIANSVSKLKESNKEMLEYDPEEKDEDLVSARHENVGTIERAEERLEMMRKRLEYLDPLDHGKA